MDTNARTKASYSDASVAAVPELGAGKLAPPRDSGGSRFAAESATRTSSAGEVGPASTPAARRRGAGRAPDRSDAEREYRDYRRAIDGVLEELKRAEDYFEGDVLTDEGSAVAVEVDGLLDDLSRCGWGQGESLALAVTALRIPTRNSRWTRYHVRFLEDGLKLLRVQYLLDQSAVQTIKGLVKEYRFDLFRGSVREPDVIRKYRIVEE